MRLLLDTHTFLWHADASPLMSAVGTSLLVDPANDLFLSMASVWEIAIKVGLKKLTLSSAYIPFMSRAIVAYGLNLLPITFEDCAEYEALPFPLPRHRDPFDRLIITHAKRNALSVVGADMHFDLYGITRLW
jgi:PIN domain nuclease of toxin-antitoxin system